MNAQKRAPRTIVFVHGAFVSRACWRRWVQRSEARGYECHALAYPGREAPAAELRAKPDTRFLGSLTFSDVLEHHVRAIQALPEKPLVIGHSLGGLLAQLLLQRGVASAAVAVDSVPPQFVTSLAWSFLRSLWPVVHPLVPVTRPYLMTLDQFRYTFANGLPDPLQRAAYDEIVVPESRRAARGALTSTARIDFSKPKPPLLFVAGQRDNLMPASLNRRNFQRYRRSPSVTDFVEFEGRTHLSVIAGEGWEDVHDHVLSWATGVGGLAAEPRATPALAQSSG
ncbi:MAG: alpha/beta hydrolase [Planctomycetes bacterium]|nr:alpha/beta hydrolase [Planctomycetota bacterium]